jgi:aspartate carbamoyltransferase
MNLINLDSLTKNEIISIFTITKKYYESRNKKTFIQKLFPSLDIKNRVLVSAFFEPSTRTQLSFESAMLRIGGQVLRFNKDTSSVKKGETFTDTIKTIENYGDIMVIRHPTKGILNDIGSVTQIPVINGGDGDGEHPTQALLDLFCIWMKYDGDIEGRVVILYGDCKHSRTIHSLVKLLELFGIKYYYLAYPNRYILNNYMNILLEHLKDSNPDVIYCTRMQNERGEGQSIPNNMIINKSFINTYIDNNKILNDEFLLLHPLPRNEEISEEIDNETYVGYFDAMKYSVYLRGVLICKCLLKN